MAEARTSRARGLLLMCAGALTFVGTTLHRLPYEAFFPALGVCLIGVLVFIKDNREATAQSEARIRRVLDPQLRNESLERFAARQARADGRTLESLAARRSHRGPARATSPAAPAAPAAAPLDEIELTEISAATSGAIEPQGGGGFVLSSDVSFPVELQQSQSLAEQLQKLNRLREDGVLDAEEFAIAKAKLLG